MDLTQLANLGEFIGGVAVLVTLIYLAAELRRSRLANEVASVEALMAGRVKVTRGRGGSPPSTASTET